MIEAKNLSKHYKDKLAVDDLSFTVAPGKVTGFLGPNGAGKSTTMRLLLGLDRPDTGSASICGKPYRDLVLPMRVAGALLEAQAVHKGRSAYNHLLCLAQTQGLPARRVDEVIALVGLNEAGRKRAGGFLSAWASGSESPPRCSGTRRCCFSMSRSTGSTLKACCGSGT